MTYLRRSCRPIIILHGRRVDPRYYVGCVGITPEDGWHEDGELKWTMLHRVEGGYEREHGLYHWSMQRNGGRWLYVYGSREECERYGQLEPKVAQGRLL